jgi:hypothetical protein
MSSLAPPLRSTTRRRTPHGRTTPQVRLEEGLNLRDLKVRPMMLGGNDGLLKLVGVLVLGCGGDAGPHTSPCAPSERGTGK